MAERIYIVCADSMCFFVDATTLDPLGCECYDPYWSAPYAPQPQMSHSEWTLKHVPMLLERLCSGPTVP